MLWCIHNLRRLAKDNPEERDGAFLFASLSQIAAGVYSRSRDDRNAAGLIE